MTQGRRSFLAPTLGFATERPWRSPCSFRAGLSKRHSPSPHPLPIEGRGILAQHASKIHMHPVAPVYDRRHSIPRARSAVIDRRYSLSVFSRIRIGKGKTCRDYAELTG